MNEKLKPCPFCGLETYVMTDDGMEHPNTLCPLADVRTTWEEWNTRPIEDALCAERDAFKDEVKQLKWELDDMRGMYGGVREERDALKKQLEVNHENPQ